MIMEYLENIVQLLAILVALLMSLFGYISSKKRAWLSAVGFFAGSLLSCYFWTAYLVIMGDTPNSSDTLTYFGWNTSYFMLLILVLYVKSKEERRYFNPIMLVPIPLNIWQLIIYLDFDGIVNSIYQVTICTAVSCLCLQSILWYFKKREEGVKFPHIALAVFICICAEFGMWTSTCFDTWVNELYYPFSFICSLDYLFIVWAVRRKYESEEEKKEAHSDSNMQKLLKGSYLAIVLVGSLGGIVLGCWIRDKLTAGTSGDQEASIYDIIPVILFITSIVLAVFAMVIIFIVYFSQKMAENNRLREERQVADRSNTAKSEFLANMSHEIRTPINAVLGMNKMIMRDSIRARDDLPHDREAIKMLLGDITNCSANIDSAGNNLLSIINDILDLSKIEAGKLEITDREYKLSTVLNDVGNVIHFRAKDKGLEYHVDTDADIPDLLFGDEMRMRQVISNIVNNAVKYTDKGSVTLSVFGGGKTRYEAGQTLELIIAVKDTGIGIKQADLDRIFEKFERTDLDRNSTVEGTGLGLAITHHLLSMMGGTISVASEYGKGSVFTIRIPQKIVSPEPIGDFRQKFEKSIKEMPDTGISLRASNARILIVDDTPMNLTVAVGLLKDTGIKAETADSGAKALELTAANSYDIILLDQRMPDMNGTQTLQHMREQQPGLSTPVICLTADAITGAKERYISEGFSDYLSKPIDFSELMKILIKYLPPDKVLRGADNAGAKKPVETVSPEDNAAFFEALRAAGIDTERGLMYCQNDSRLYRTVLADYQKSAGEKTEKMQAYCDSGDWKNYAVLVHSLKSASRTIGAKEVAESAAMLEKAADEKNAELILEEHPKMTELYKTAVNAIASAGMPAAAGPAETAPAPDGAIMEFVPKSKRTAKNKEEIQ